MRRLRPRFDLALVAGGSVLAGLVAWSSPATGDYIPGGPVVGDANAAPAIEALAHGHFAAFVAHQPVMGLVSLLVRVPAALLAPARPNHGLLEYRLGAVLCLLSAVLLAAWLSRLERPTRQWRLTCLLVGALLVAGPGKIDAVRSGHPEEVLTAVLAVAAVIAAQRQREWWAGVLLGLAIGTKPWAVLAGVPVFLALERCHWKAGLAALAVAATAMVGAALNPAAFLTRAGGVGGMRLINPYSLWWPAGSGVSFTLVPIRILPWGLTRSSALVLATGLAAAAAVGWSLRRGWSGATNRWPRVASPLALLACLWLVRAVADPHPLEYYYVPFLIATAAWEAYSLRRPPFVAVASGGLLVLTFVLPFDQPTWPNTFLLIWTASVGIYLASQAFRSPAARPGIVQSSIRYFNSLRSRVDLDIDHVQRG